MNKFVTCDKEIYLKLKTLPYQYFKYEVSISQLSWLKHRTASK